MSQKRDKKIPESAEELNDYIHITTPSVWLILLAVSICVAGLVIWSLTADLATAVPAAVVSKASDVHLYVSADNAASVNAGNPVIIQDRTYSVQSVSDSAIAASVVLNEYERSLIAAKANDPVIECIMEGTMPEGDYNAMIVVATEHPISFLFRSNKR